MERNPLLRAISDWFARVFNDPQSVSLFALLVISVLMLEYVSMLVVPLLVSAIFAYLLMAPVHWLEKHKVSHLLAVIIVYLAALGAYFYVLFYLVPSLLRQLSSLVNEIPTAFSQWQTWLQGLAKEYPNILSVKQLGNIAGFLKHEITQLGQLMLQFSFGLIPGLIHAILYLVLVPLMVFFMLKDSTAILDWMSQYMPQERGFMRKVWDEVNVKIGAYVRGRILEVIVVSIVTIIIFAWIGIQYTVLLGILVGLSVLIPYVGEIIVIIPVTIVALMQWGFTAKFFYIMIAYVAITTLDVNLLVPILFSEVMDLHPLVIIISVIFFGGVWGLWGMFFAIPLATVLVSIVNHWPRTTFD